MERITINELKEMRNREGLIIQGCGGDLNDWINGIQEMLTEANILKDGERFKKICAFEYQGLTCLLFDFEDVKLDIGRLAMWRLQTYGNFGGTWLSDYLPNQLGVDWGEDEPEQIKPDCELIGQDSNIYNLIGIAARTLRENDMHDAAEEMTNRITSTAHSYDEALNIIGEYVNITGPDEPELGM